MANGAGKNPNGNGGPGVVILPSDAGNSDSGGGAVADGTVGSAQSGSGGSVDPESLVGNPGPSIDTDAPYGRNADGSPARKRGRKPGSGGSGSTNSGSAKSTTSKSNSSVSGLEKLLFSVHAMGAGFLKVPELQIDTQEAHLLATAVDAVQKHYDWDASAETIIWVNLVGAMITVYGPRVAVLMSKQSKAKKPAPPVTATADGAPGVYSILGTGNQDATSR